METHRTDFNTAIDCYNLGNQLREQGHTAQAIAYYQQAIALNPYLLAAYNNLGSLLGNDPQTIPQAIHYLETLLNLDPTYTKALHNLARIYLNHEQLTSAFNCYQQALLILPNDSKLYNSLGYILTEQARLDQAIPYFKKALTLTPTSVITHNNLLMALHYTDYPQSTLFKEYQQFDKQHALPLAPLIKPHTNSPDPQRRLKIAYLSPDFRRHAIAYFIKAILAHHNHQHFELFCYYNHPDSDDFTQEIQTYADHWINCYSLSDQDLVQHLRDQRIDLLIDLAGHGAGNRSLIFAQKPAPLQIAYLGYSNTTGLTAMDSRITDEHTDPSDPAVDALSSETLIRLPNTYFCYSPPKEFVPIQPQLPCQHQNHLTFGSFNNYPKLSPQILHIWAQLLQQLPTAKLLIKAKQLADLQTKTALLHHFARFNLPPERLILIPSFIPSTIDNLKTYSMVDIALDSYPYNGATTTCESLWMGIPVITLVGERHVSRMGLSLLSTLKLPQLIAHSPAEYIQIAKQLALDFSTLQTLRTTLRTNLQNSPIMDASTTTQQLEHTYQTLWQQWCASHS